MEVNCKDFGALECKALLSSNTSYPTSPCSVHFAVIERRQPAASMAGEAHHTRLPCLFFLSLTAVSRREYSSNLREGWFVAPDLNVEGQSRPTNTKGGHANFQQINFKFSVSKTRHFWCRFVLPWIAFTEPIN